MTRRIAAVLALASATRGAPPGIERNEFGRALVEDTAELLSQLQACECAVVASPPGYADELRTVLWADTPLITVDAGETAATTFAAFAAVQALGADHAVVVAGDAPDLPGLLVGKLFSALTSADAAICPAGTGLVAFAARLPVADWLPAANVGLDTPDAHGRLAGAAPEASSLVVTSGWHRLRTPADIRALDYGLEGWEMTRALLAGY